MEVSGRLCTLAALPLGQGKNWRYSLNMGRPYAWSEHIEENRVSSTSQEWKHNSVVQSVTQSHYWLGYPSSLSQYYSFNLCVTLFCMFLVLLCFIWVISHRSCSIWKLRYGCWHAVEVTELHINFSFFLHHKARNKWYYLLLPLRVNVLHCRHTNWFESDACHCSVKVHTDWLDVMCCVGHVQAFCVVAASRSVRVSSSWTGLTSCWCAA